MQKKKVVKEIVKKTAILPASKTAKKSTELKKNIKPKSSEFRLPNNPIYESLMTHFPESLHKIYKGKPIPYAEGTMICPDGTILED